MPFTFHPRTWHAIHRLFWPLQIKRALYPEKFSIPINMERRFRQAVTALKEHSYVGYAKIATLSGFCDLELILVKATAPDDLPSPEKYIQELLKIFSISPCSHRAFSLSFARRFGKTRSWRVALKCLLLLHRLIRSVSGKSCQSEFCWSKSNGLLSLYPCYFRDASSSTGSEDFTLFIRSYARLLDEALDWFVNDAGMLTPMESSPEKIPEKMKEVRRVLDLLLQLQNLIDRVIDCEPNGTAAKSVVIRLAMKLIVRDSFICYAVFRRDIVFLLDNLFQMQFRCCVAAFRIYQKAASQGRRLSQFYEVCKEMGLCGSYEYPIVDRIPAIHVQALESFLNGMWELTDEEGEETTSSSQSLSSTEGEEEPLQLVLFPTEPFKTVIRTEWEKFEEEEEVEPLIDLGENGGGWDWEALLESSAAASPWVHLNFVNVMSGFVFPAPEAVNGGKHSKEDSWEEREGLMLQVYNPNPISYG